MTDGSSPAITVLFATHNGEQTLPRMLQALRGLTPPRRPWSILAVDNASTDATPDILRAAARDLPIQVLTCPTPGKTAALAHAAAHVRGDLVVFTDDDVEPAPDWLTAFEAAADAHPEAGLFGGAIEPVAFAEPGPWFHASAAHHRELFAHCEIEAGPIEPVGTMFGPNFMMRAQYLGAVADVPGYVGPRFDGAWRRRYPMGQDTRVMMGAAARGAQAFGVPAARVRHLIRPHQTELGFMLDRAARHGRGTALEMVSEDSRALLRRLKLVVKSAARSLALPKAPAEPDPAAFERMWNAHWLRGLMLGAAFGPFAR